MGRLIGIDLGTTSSCVAVLEGGAPQVIPNQEGARTTPSVVAFTDAEVLVGASARRQALTNPKRTVTAVKRLLGRRARCPEAERARRSLPFELREGHDGALHIAVEDTLYSPSEIASLILSKLKTAAEGYVGEAVEEAVIAVPASFGAPQRLATKEAGRLAGLELALTGEPAAAALAGGLQSRVSDGQLVAVYDLGGGSFEISILEMTEGTFRVRATRGDPWLGGEDFDQRIVDWLLSEVWSRTRSDLGRDPQALQRLREVAERAKCALSDAPQANFTLPAVSAAAAEVGHLQIVLTRERYESFTDDLLQRTIEPCQVCLADAGRPPEKIHDVLLVGGQTCAPAVAALVRRVFGREPDRTISANWGVAMGAAIQAGLARGEATS